MDNILAIADFVNSLRRAIVKARREGLSAADVDAAVAQVQSLLNKEKAK